MRQVQRRVPIQAVNHGAVTTHHLLVLVLVPIVAPLMVVPTLVLLPRRRLVGKVSTGLLRAGGTCRVRAPPFVHLLRFRDGVEAIVTLNVEARRSHLIRVHPLLADLAVRPCRLAEHAPPRVDSFEATVIRCSL